MLSNSLRAAVASIVLAVMAGCSGGAFSRHTDGPLTVYLQQPIPRPQRPLARTLSLEIVSYNTAGGDKATMVSDLVGTDLYILPEDVGEQVGEVLGMDAAFSESATMAALDMIAKNRNTARHASTMRRAKDAPTTVAPAANEETGPTDVQQLEKLAVQASAQGKPLMASVYEAAAIRNRPAAEAFDPAIARSQATTARLQASHKAGVALLEGQFAAVRRWIEQESGAVGPDAPAGTHLSVFLLEYFDAKWGRLDSQMRAAVLLVLVDAEGRVTTALEGSDVLTCAGECNVFTPKPTAKPIRMDAISDDVRNDVLGLEGIEARKTDGFSPLAGIYQYLLFHHALAELTRRGG